MPRAPRTQERSDGSLNLRVDIPAAIRNLCDEFATEMGIDRTAAIRMLLAQIARSVTEGDVGFLSKDFQGALVRLRERTFGMVDTTSHIDLNKLHRSAQTKSGFVGVYANGKGFRSMVTHGGKLTAIGTFPTAEEAAWRRRKYYLEHGLPYGELEIEMEIWRKGKDGTPPFRGTDAELIEAIKEHAQRANTYDAIFGDGNNDSLVGATQAPKMKVEPKAIGFDDATADEIFG